MQVNSSRHGRLGLAACGVFFSLALGTGVAHAGESREHDGFYLRLGAGFGFFSDAASSASIPILGKTEGTPTAFAVASEVAVGGSPLHGLVIGGGIYSSWAPSPRASHIKQGDVSVTLPEDVEFDASQFHLIAPFIDYYFDPERGLHLQGALGLGILKTGDGHETTSNTSFPYGQTATGFGFMVGFGDEWWVGRDWGLGVLARLSMGFVGGDDDNSVQSVHWSHTVFCPAVLFTASMN
jgi:hypothetical protein